MALPKSYGTYSEVGAGTTASVANGATTVTGTGTAWSAVVRESDYFEAQGLRVRIKEVVSDTELTLIDTGWPGTTLDEDPYEISITRDGPENQLQNRRYYELMGQLTALGIQPDAFGEFSDRDAYDDAAAGFIFLSLNGDAGATTTAWTLYTKLSSDDADWSTGQTIEGPQGEQGDPGLIGDWKEAWVTATAYDLLDAVAHDGSSYICEEAHTSGTFATDLAAGKWRVVAAKGDEGDSAYDVAVAEGFVGDEAAWLASLEGPAGVDGTGAFARVRAVATSNITISTALNNGDSVDGVTLATNDLVLVAGQSAPAENGIYVVGAVPARDSSFDTFDEHPGVYVSVMEGTANADTLWRCTSNKGGTIDSTALAFEQFSGGLADPSKCSGRLTLESGVAISTSDQTAKGTLYFTPYMGNAVSLYDGAAWQSHTLTEISIALSGGTASKVHDVFLYNSSGTLTLELVAWTDDSTRATGLATQDGVAVKSGSATKRYLGTIYLDASKQCEDSVATRHVWNYLHRILRPMRRFESGSSWNYTTATWRQANANTANRLSMVRGLNEDAVVGEVATTAENTNNGVSLAIAIGVNSTTAPDAASGIGSVQSSAGNGGVMNANYAGLPGIGLIRLNWLEYSEAVGTSSWYGLVSPTNRSGLTAGVFA